MFDIEKYDRERHNNKLPTTKSRREFAATMISTMEVAIVGLQDTIQKLRDNPDKMLIHAFSPNLIGMMPSTVAHLELVYGSQHGVPIMEIWGKTKVGPDHFNEVGFRAIWSEGGTIVPRRSNRF